MTITRYKLNLVVYIPAFESDLGPQVEVGRMNATLLLSITKWLDLSACQSPMLAKLCDRSARYR